MKHLVLLVVSTMVLLSGCASPIRDATLNQKTQLGSQDGLVAVQVVNNAERLSGLHNNWTSVTAVRLDNMQQLKAAAIQQAKEKAKGKAIDESKVDWTPEIYSMRPISAGGIGSQLFVGMMPAGEYTIAELEAYYSDGNMSSWITMPVRFTGGDFVVGAHQFTNLGGLVFQPLKSIRQESFWSNSSSQRAYVTRLPQTTDFLPFIKAMYPQAVSQLSTTTSTANGWKTDPLDHFRRDLATLSRTNVLLTSSAAAAAANEAWLYGKLGQVRHLEAGTWRVIDLPTSNQLGALLDTERFSLAGGEQGEVFYRATASSSWQRLTPVAATEAVIGFSQSGKDVFALTQSAAAVKIYKITDPVAAWREVGQFPIQISSVFIKYGSPWLVAIPSGVRLFNDEQAHDFNATTGQWTAFKTTGLMRLADLGGGVLIGLESSSWDGIGDTLYSADFGKSWLKVDRSSSFWAPDKFEYSLPAKVADRLVLIDMAAKPAIPANKPNKKSLRLISKALSQLGEKTSWQVEGEAIPGCETLLPQISSADRLYALCEYGKVVSTADLGATWRTDIDVNIDAMQTKQQQFVRKLLDQLKAEEQKDAAKAPAPQAKVN